jgi:hypothetical protein
MVISRFHAFSPLRPILPMRSTVIFLDKPQAGEILSNDTIIDADGIKKEAE